MKKFVLVGMIALFSVLSVFAQEIDEMCLVLMENYTSVTYAFGLDDVIGRFPPDDRPIYGWAINQNVSDTYLAFPLEPEFLADGRVVSGSFGLISSNGDFVTQNGEYAGMSLSEDGALLYSFLLVGQPYTFIKTETQRHFVVGATNPNWGPNQLFTATDENGNLNIYDVEGNSSLIAEDASNGAWSPNGLLFSYATSQSGNFVVIELATNAVVYEAPEDFWAYDSVWLSDSVVAVSGMYYADPDQHLKIFAINLVDGSIYLAYEVEGRDLYDLTAYQCVDGQGRNRA